MKELVKFLTKGVDNLTLRPEIQEEFLDPSGEFNIPYLQFRSEEVFTKATLYNTLNQELGAVKFNISENFNEVDTELFYSEYEFGKFANVRSWIHYFHSKYGKLLTRQALHEYLLKGKD
jgi:hypothetical protein